MPRIQFRPLTLVVCLGVLRPLHAGWEPAGPFGGPAETVAAQAWPGYVLAGTPSGSIFRSADGGRRWTRVPFPLESGCGLHAILPDPDSPERFWTAVSPHSGGASGLYETRDGGRHWQPSAAFAGREVWALSRSPLDPSVIAAGAGDGVYMSRDGGQRWDRVSPASNPDLAPVVSLAFHPSDPLRLFAGTTHLPWLTSDGGATWRSVHEGMIDDSDVFAIHVDKDEPSRVFASACSGMYRSADGGQRWSKLRGAPDASFRTYAIARSPHERTVVYAGTSGGLIRSDDAGTTWRTILPGTVKAVTFEQGASGAVYAASANGVVRGAGAKFDLAANGFAARDPRWMALAGGSLWTASSTDGGLYRRDGGSAWKRVRTSALIAMADGPGKTLWGVTPSGVFTSATAGTTWTPVAAPQTRIHGIAAQGADLFIATEAGLFRSIGGARPWKREDIGFAGPVQQAGPDWALGARAASVRTEAGWALLTPPAAAVDWYGVAVSGATVLAATSHGLFRSADTGRTWEAAAGSLGSETATAVLFHPGRPGVAFAAQHGRVFVSSDEGRTWRRTAGDGLQGASVRRLAADPESGRLIALAAGRGIYFGDWEK